MSATALNTKKDEIFDVSVMLFAQYGFESVSIRDIAKAVSVKSSSLYYHYASKQQILDEIYAYFTEHFNDNRKPVAVMKQLLQTATKEEFGKALMFTFETPDFEKWQRMTLIVKIIYMRIFQDNSARDIFLNLMNKDTEAYVKEILEYGIAIGTLQDFDIQAYLDILVGQRHIMGIKAFANPDYIIGQLDEEKRIMKMSTDLLPFIKR